MAYLHSSYEGLRDASGEKRGVNITDVGANFYLDGHNAKFTLNYRNRPDFSLPAGTPGTVTAPSDIRYRPEITLQTQVFL